MSREFHSCPRDLSIASASSIRQSHPLSSSQMAVSLEQALYPDLPLYNIGGYGEISGPLDPELFQLALRQVVRQADALRMVFSQHDGTPTQRCLDDPDYEVPFLDFSAAEDPERASLAWMQQRFVESYVLECGLLFTFALLKLAENRYRWFKKFHHLLTDGWGISLTVQKVAAAYNQLLSGNNEEPRAYPYTDFIEQDQQYLNSSQYAADREYWSAKYRQLPEPLFAPRAGSQVRRDSPLARCRTLRLGHDLYRRLEELAAAQRASTFHVILAALGCYFSRVSNAEEVTVGLPLLNRRGPAFKQTIGMFTGMMAARIPVSAEAGMGQMLRVIGSELRSNYRHQSYPLVVLQRDLQLHQQDRRQLFDFTLSYEKHDYKTHFGDASYRAVALLNGHARAPLEVFVREFHHGEDVLVDFHYALSTFADDEIERLCERLEFLLGAIVEHVESPIKTLPLMTPRERHRLLVEWNDTAADYPRDQCIQQLFEEQARRTPGAVAVVFEDRQLTYAQLNGRANQLAHHLRRLGVGPEVLVGICVERSLEMVVGLLGILKAGGAYVPLDPDYPIERLAFMLEDTQAPVLLTQQALLERLPASDAQVVCLDTDWQQIDQQPDANLPAQANADNLAYVIYTSGSTGRAKGSLITHACVMRLFTATEAWFAFNETDVWTLFHSFAFDFSVWELWGALLYGGKLVITPYWISRSPEEFLRILTREGVTVLNQTPSAFFGLMRAVEASSPEQDLNLRWVIFGGEALVVDGLRSWFDRHGDQKPRLVNMYGITETTVHVTYRPLSLQDTTAQVGSPIGISIADLQLYVLDRHQNPTPIGVAGELYVDGAGLARGYLNRPELTAEKFIPNPFGTAPGSRLYRTGDLCRWLPDGNLEFLGRLDHQVKIRGYRIEPGEIESALRAHGQVREAVVLAREDEPGEKRLVAYVVPAALEETTVSASALREHLQASLPSYMVPWAFVFLEALPLTPNGKLDRRSLPAPEGPLELEGQYILPRNPVEEQLCAIWQEVLRLERVGVQDNFFQLGGHSLLATQVISRVRGAFQVELPVAALFTGPTVAELGVALQQQWSAGAAVVVPALVAQEREEEVPLSFAQQRLWFLDQLLPESPQYNMPGALRLRGRLDRPALERAWQRLVQRHEALRTRFESRGGQPRQVIEAGWVQPLVAYEDLRALSAAEREAEALRRAQQEASRPFDLSRGPLLRVFLWQLSDEEQVLLVNLHHIVADGWSIGVLVRELSRLYGAFCAGQADPLPPLSVQYPDYAIWQRSWLCGDVLEGQLGYWREQLAGVEVLELPTDHPRPAVSAGRGASVEVQLPRSLSAGLKQLCLEQEVSLFMLLLSAWQVLLSRYTGQEDIVVGSPIANRTQRHTEGLIGFFVNTLALRNDLSGDPRFSDLLGQVRERTLAAYAHQDLPFEQLVDALELERDLSRESLVQVMFAWQNAPPAALELGELSWESLPLEQTTSKFDLALSLGESAEGLSGSLEYRSDLFERETIERMVGHLRRLLEGIISAPESRLSQLPLLTEEERRQLLVEWNDTAADYPRDQCIQQLFEEQARRTPEAVAVVFEDRQLTYAQLNGRANQLAHHLRRLGVGPEVLVGICVERSLEMVVGLLGILKAGGAYVPLDPDYPIERLAFMLEDTQAPVLLTQQALLERLPASDAQVVCLDTGWQQIDQQPDANLPAQANADNLAYVIYTSGSTGRPKGVAMRHGALENLIRWQIEDLSGFGSACTLQFASLNFDVSFQEIFSTWCLGGMLVLVDDQRRRDSRALLHYIGEQQIQRLFLPFVALQHLALCAATQEIEMLTLRDIITAGEQLQVTPELRGFMRRRPDCRMHNHYGPTESHVVTSFTLPARIETCQEFVPIGCPLPNAQTYVLDRDQQPVPVGVVGELYLGGAALARGYLNRPELTAEKFIPNPFSVTPGSRLYRTGDLCRWLPDGNLEFLGRLDHQVKIRGYRIEPGEIESALRAHGQVREAVVLARGDEPGEKRLVAYVVPAALEETIVSASALREHLQRSLPPYMVPWAFVFLEALPLTPNGKLDRRSLAAPEGPLELEGQYILPRNPVEEQLCAIWQEVLRLERVGVQDNFFQLGGHSLLATQVISRVRGAFQVELPVAALFTRPTVAELGVALQQQWSAGAAVVVPALVAQEREEEVPLSFAQQRLWFLDQLLPESPQYNMPGALRLRGRLDRPALERAWQRLVQRHEALRTRFESRGGQPRQVIEAEWVQPLLAYEDLRPLSAGEREAEALRRAQQEASRPFDLSRGPLLRVFLWQLSDEEQVLLVNLHHIVADGWSIGVLVRELSRLYGAFCAGQADPLPPLSVQYADYAIWQRGWLRGEVLEGQLGYWREQLAGVEVLELPTDHPRPAVSAGRGASVEVQLPRSLSAGLKQLCLEQEVSLFMLLLSAWQVLLSRYTGQEDIVVGSPIANRTQRHTEGLIGLFVNTLALRNDLSGDPRFSDLLGQVRERTLAAYAHQDLPFEQLVDALELERDLSRESLVQVMFAWQNAPPAALELGELSWESLPLEQTTSKFDLTLSLGESAEGLSGSLQYRSDLFERETIERMVGHLRRLLEGIVSAPESRLSQLPLLTEEERRQLLVEWNDTAADYPRDQCIQQLFEEQARRTPGAVAVVFEDRQLTYAQLNGRANQLAHHLRRLGVGPEVLVGICVERSLEMVVGLLGILKAGGAYVPLDPDYPIERLAFMLEDTQAPVLLTQQALLERLPASDAQVVCLDTDWQQIDQQPDANLPAQANADNLAYVIYTSGSTGRAKGSLITHACVMRLFTATEAWFAFNETDVWTLFHSFAFDFSVWELWGALLYGGKLVITPYWISRSPEEFLRILTREGVTVLNQTPSAFFGLMRAVEASSPEQDLNLRWVIFGGEALVVDGLRSWFDRHGDQKPRLVNMYGITETTVHVTYRPLSLQDTTAQVGSPIGISIADLQLYVLDRHQNPTPIGVAGELYVDGAGLARGYLNRPELTAEKFIPNPFGTAPGSRLYRTGDLCRWLPDGNLEFLGRLDHQVKIRGYRIEPGEIESALRAHGQVREAVVLAREDEPGEKRLVAYVVPAALEETTVSASALREHLQASLPSYMVPWAFVFLEALPLTPNGKLDRRSLPAPEGPLELEGQYVPPRNPVEEQLCAIWQEVLRLERVGVHDNFFQLGGDSILSIQVIARAGVQGLRLTVRQVFEHQTIAALAEVAREPVEVQADQGLVQGEAPLTPIQHWFFEQDLSEAHHWNQAVLLTPKQRLCRETLQQAAERLQQQHDALRLRFHCEAGSWRQSFAVLDEVCVVEGVDLSQVEASQQASQLEQQAGRRQASLDLEAGPLWRMTLFELGADRPQRLLIAIHHLAVDGVSWRIVLEDLGQLYTQAAAGEPLSLPNKTSSVQQWAGRLQQYAQSEALRAELDYWQDVVRLGPAAFPMDDPQGDNTAASAQAVSITLSREQTEALLRQVPAAYQTQINDVLLTALLQAYAAWSGQDSLLLDLEGHGREELFADLDVSRTVGWFTTIYPVRLESPDVASAEVSLKAVKEQLRAVPQRGIGYGVLRYLSQSSRAEVWREGPDPALSFNYLGQFDTDNSNGLWEVAAESAGPSHSPVGRRRHLIDVTGIVSGGRLRMDWTYSEQIHHRATVAALAEHFQVKLEALIGHCVSAEAGGYTPSDFPLSGLEQWQLERLVSAEQARAKTIEDIYPLSPMQQGMLYHTLREPDSGVYYEQLVFELEGPLELEAFARAWQQVQRRHAVLRTTFLWQGVPQMLQVVHRRQDLPFGCCDWRDRPVQQQQRDLASHLASCRSAGFDLEAGPLWGVELIRQSETCWWCVFSSHHALWDGWSLPVIVQEMLQGYQAALEGRWLSLPEARPYRDYIAWLGGKDRQAAEAFWREQLSGLSSATLLGVERVLTEAESGPAEVDLPLEAALRGRLRQFARRHRLTLNTLLQGAWALLLSRYSGQEEVIFGATTSGRPAELAGVERMVGLFINTLPVRVRVAGDRRVGDWLSQLQQRQVAARQFEHCSLVDLQGWSEVPAGTPLFESLLVFENYPVSEELRSSRWGGLRVGGVEVHEQTNYPLTIMIIPAAVSLKFQYDRNRFERGTIERMAGHLRRLLEGIVSAPESRLSQLPLLTEEERRQLLVEWNDTAADYPRDQCIQQLFEEQARRTPGAVAVVFEDRQLTYAQLNARANQLAHHLRRLGVGPEVLVGICVERSLEMVVGLLGILKAGGAYVPLDPDYPRERLTTILCDSRPKAVVTLEKWAKTLPPIEGAIVCLDRDSEEISIRSKQNPKPQSSSSHLCYIIYTSGSTGKPKGVMVEHHSVTRLVLNTNYIELGSKDRCLQCGSLAFDNSTFEIWGQLLNGGTICSLPPEISVLSSSEISALIRAHGITVISWVCSVFNHHVSTGIDLFKDLEAIVIGGEKASNTHINKLKETWPDIRIILTYGPTENTTFSTYHWVERFHSRDVPIGKPIANSEVVILNSHGQLAPIGVPGELCTGGEGLARGYLNSPELTAEKFIPNPFSAAPGSRLYRTGDLCRWLPDGNLEFLGRLDHQVKIRGYRIELGEIESALLAHGQVREAVVLAREDQPGEKRLVAYVVPAAGDGSTVSPAILREHLSAGLPLYMVPSAFVFLEALPLTPNGKLDRRSLPALDGHLERGGQYVPARNPVEEQLCAIWQEVLRLERVGVQDNFFELGGHSLLATQVISRIRGTFQVELPVAALFTSPTLSQLGTWLDELTATRRLGQSDVHDNPQREKFTL